MSIVTKTGDQGTTALMYNRCVSKTHPRVAAYGAVDELNAALGMARAVSLPASAAAGQLLDIQHDLVAVMGELATASEDRERYLKDGYVVLNQPMTARLEGVIRDIEARNISFRGWATPGASVQSAALDIARTVCRRAERAVCALHESRDLPSAEILVYLNRLSDALWLLARQSEATAEKAPG